MCGSLDAGDVCDACVFDGGAVGAGAWGWVVRPLCVGGSGGAAAERHERKSRRDVVPSVGRHARKTCGGGEGRPACLSCGGWKRTSDADSRCEAVPECRPRRRGMVGEMEASKTARVSWLDRASGGRRLRLWGCRRRPRALPALTADGETLGWQARGVCGGCDEKCRRMWSFFLLLHATHTSRLGSCPQPEERE